MDNFWKIAGPAITIMLAVAGVVYWAGFLGRDVEVGHTAGTFILEEQRELRKRVNKLEEEVHRHIGEK